MSSISGRSIRNLFKVDSHTDLKEQIDEPSNSRRKFAFINASPGRRKKSAAKLEKSRAHAKQLADFSPHNDTNHDFNSNFHQGFTSKRPAPLNFANLETDSVFSGLDTVYGTEGFDDMSVYSNTSMFSSKRMISRPSPNKNYRVPKTPSKIDQNSYGYSPSPVEGGIFHPINMKNRLGTMGFQSAGSENGLSPMNSSYNMPSRRYRSSPSSASVVSTASSVSGAAARRLMRHSEKTQQMTSNISIASDVQSHNSNWYESPIAREYQHRRQSSSFTEHTPAQEPDTGFTFDAFGLDEIQIHNDVDRAIADLATSDPDISFFLNCDADEYSRISTDSPNDQPNHGKKFASYTSSDTVSTSPLTASSFVGSTSRPTLQSNQNCTVVRVENIITKDSSSKITPTDSEKRKLQNQEFLNQEFLNQEPNSSRSYSKTLASAPKSPQMQRRSRAVPTLKTIQSVDLPDIGSEDSDSVDNNNIVQSIHTDFNCDADADRLSTTGKLVSTDKTEETNYSGDSNENVKFVPRIKHQPRDEILSASQLRAQEWRAARGDAPIILSPLLIARSEKALKDKPSISQQRAREWAEENPNSPVKELSTSYSMEDHRTSSVPKHKSSHSSTGRPSISPSVHSKAVENIFSSPEILNLRKIEASTQKSITDDYRADVPMVSLRRVESPSPVISSSPTNFLENVKLKKTLIPARRIKNERESLSEPEDNKNVEKVVTSSSANYARLSESPSDEVKKVENLSHLSKQPIGIIQEDKFLSADMYHTDEYMNTEKDTHPVAEMIALQSGDMKSENSNSPDRGVTDYSSKEPEPPRNKVASLFAQRASASSPPSKHIRVNAKEINQGNIAKSSAKEDGNLLSMLSKRVSKVGKPSDGNQENTSLNDVMAKMSIQTMNEIDGVMPPLKNDPTYSKYFKMLKMGLPLEAVKHAMSRDGVDPNVMDGNHDLPANRNRSGVPRKEDPRYQKYFKMLKIGLPIGAVKNAMERDGEDPAVLDGDPNTPAESHKKHSDDNECNIPKDSFRRTRVHWNTIGEVKSTSVWAMVNQDPEIEKIEIDESEFAELFQAEMGQTVTTESEGSKKRNAVKVIEPKRANNGGIVLARLKITYEEMAGAIDSIDEKAMTLEQVQGILEYIPTKEEKTALRKYMTTSDKDSADAFDDLCECEKFMVAMMTVKHSKEKVKALLFKLQFRQFVSDMEKDVLKVEKACDDLRNSVRLRKLLGIVLNIGNRLNTAGSTRKGKAGAFTIESLLKLNQAKAFDKKTTFLQYVIIVVNRHNSDLLDFKYDLQSVMKADKIYWDQIENDLEEVEGQLENVRKIALHEVFGKKPSWVRRRRNKAQDDELSHESMTLEEEVEALRSTSIGIFTLQAIKIVSNLRENVEMTSTKFKKLLEYFGEDDKKKMHPHHLFQIMCAFIKEFDSAKDQMDGIQKQKTRKDDDISSSKSSNDNAIKPKENVKIRSTPPPPLPSTQTVRGHDAQFQRNVLNDNSSPSNEILNQNHGRSSRNTEDYKRSSSRLKREPVQMKEIAFKTKLSTVSNERFFTENGEPPSIQHTSREYEIPQVNLSHLSDSKVLLNEIIDDSVLHDVRRIDSNSDVMPRNLSRRLSRPSPDSPTRRLSVPSASTPYRNNNGETQNLSAVKGNLKETKSSVAELDMRQKARAMRQERVKSSYNQTSGIISDASIATRKALSPENAGLVQTASNDSSATALSTERERIASRRERLVRLQKERRRNAQFGSV